MSLLKAKKLGVSVLCLSLLIIPLTSTSYANESIRSSSSIDKTPVSDINQLDMWVKLPTNRATSTSTDYLLKNLKSGETVSGVVEIVDGERNSLTADEAVNKLNNIREEEETKSPQSRAYSVFYKTGTKKYIGSPRKITHDVVGPATITYKQSIGTTISHQFSTSISSEKTKIQQGSGVSWTKSVTMEYTGSRNIGSGKTAYVAFKPYYTQVNGKLNTFNSFGQLTKSKSAYGRTPRKTSIGCDGLEYLVYK